MHITLRQLRIFEAVARHKSMSRAAAELHLTQPAVSMQVKQLEDQIGLPLLQRAGRRMLLTEAGLELRAHAERFSSMAVEMRSAMDQFRGLHRGVLRLAVVSTASYFLPPLIAGLNERHPGVRISLEVGNREAVFASLIESRAHLAITGRPPDSDDLVAQHFMDNPLVVICAPTHPLAKAKSVSLQRLSEETLVVREPGSGTRATIELHFKEHGLSYKPGCELNTNEAIKQAVRAGLGIGVVSAQTIELELGARCLSIVPVEGFPILRRWYLVRRKDQRLSAAASAFREILLEQGPHGKPAAVPRKAVSSKRRATAPAN